MLLFRKKKDFSGFLWIENVLGVVFSIPGKNHGIFNWNFNQCSKWEMGMRQNCGETAGSVRNEELEMLLLHHRDPASLGILFPSQGGFRSRKRREKDVELSNVALKSWKFPRFSFQDAG